MKFEKELKSVLGVIAFFIIFYFLGPYFYSNQAFFVTMLLFATLTLSFNIIYGFTGYLPFGYAAFFGLGAYGFGIGVKFSLNIMLSFLLGILLSVGLSVIFLPMLRLKGAYFAIANLASFEAVYYIISNQSLTPITGGPYGLSTSSVFAPNIVYLISLILLIVIIVVTYIIKKSNFGLALKSIRDDQTTSILSGINVSLYRGIAWIISALFAGAAGALYGWYLGFFYPEAVLSITFTIFIITFTIFGGSGTILGPIIGTLLLYGIYDMVGVSFSEYFTLIFGLFILILMLFLPNGLKDILKKYFRRELP